jgi:NAD(P)-dependent dehydrogenase (short-subunit alcohol dehydrogenase family)
MKKLTGKTVFITGGLSGIGKACAMLALQEGANVVIADMAKTPTEEALHEIAGTNPMPFFIACNVARYSDVESAVQKTVEKYGALDVGLNNAGIGGEAGRTGDLSEKAWLDVININLNGVFNCMNHELKQMEKQKRGVIINMSSILGQVGFANSGHYVAAKHGILGLTQTAALEYATSGIRINAICPGFVETPLLAKGGITDHPDVRKMIVDLHPMNRLGMPGEIAKGFLFLASDDSSFVTGTSLAIDGGYLAK